MKAAVILALFLPFSAFAEPFDLIECSPQGYMGLGGDSQVLTELNVSAIANSNDASQRMGILTSSAPPAGSDREVRTFNASAPKSDRVPEVMKMEGVPPMLPSMDSPEMVPFKKHLAELIRAEEELKARQLEGGNTTLVVKAKRPSDECTSPGLLAKPAQGEAPAPSQL